MSGSCAAAELDGRSQCHSFCSAGFRVCAVCWSGSFNLRSRSVWMTAALAGLIVLNSSSRLIDVIWAKGIRRKNVEFARWNAISRVEVDHNRRRRKSDRDRCRRQYFHHECRPGHLARLAVGKNASGRCARGCQCASASRRLRHHWSRRRN